MFFSFFILKNRKLFIKIIVKYDLIIRNYLMCLVLYEIGSIHELRFQTLLWNRHIMDHCRVRTVSWGLQFYNFSLYLNFSIGGLWYWWRLELYHPSLLFWYGPIKKVSEIRSNVFFDIIYLYTLPIHIYYV